MMPDSRTAAIALVVLTAACAYDATYPTPASDVPASVDVVFCSSASPRWVAVQDGEGDWVPLAGEASGAITTFHLTLSADHGGIAVAREFPSGLTALAVYHGLPAELAVAGDGTTAGCAGSFDRTLVGKVAGLDTNEVARVSVDGHSFDFVSQMDGTDFRLENVAAGPQDILAARLTHVDQATRLTAIVLRHQVPADGGAIADIDFTSAEAFRPVTTQLSLVGVPGGTAQAYGIRTERGGDRILTQIGAAGGPIQALSSAPEAALAEADLQFVVATAPPIDGTNIVRASKAYFRAAVDRSLVFGPIPAPPVVTVTASEPLRLSARFTPQPEYDQAAVINFQEGQSTVVSVAMTDGYARRIGGYQLDLPDFSGVAGFESRWALRGASPILWTSSRLGGTLGLGVNAVPRDGAVRRIATDAGYVITP